VEIVYFTLAAIGLYFVANRLLDLTERARGTRFMKRQMVFFAIILVMALIAFQLMQRLLKP
jgi:cell division protein FtsW (lipid II flippase)